MAKLQSVISKDFTVIHNDFLRDERLGLEEIGMLTKLMSLPEDWNFSIKGLAKILASGERKVSTALNKLMELGYFRRIRLTDKNGRVTDWLYQFSDQVQEEWLVHFEGTEKNDDENPDLRNADVENPHLAVGCQNNNNNNKINNNILIDRYGKAEFQKTKEEVREQINEVNELVVDGCASEEEVEEIIDIMTEVYLSDDAIININGTTMKMTRVQTQFRKLTSDHIKYFFEKIKKNSKKIINIRKYIITSLYNAAMTFNNTVRAEVAYCLR